MNESHAELTAWGLSFFHWQGDEDVLDIGCGGGANLHRMSSHIESGHLTGVDYAKTSVETSRQTNADDIAAGKMTVCEGSVEALPFSDDAFDKITTVESFYFWPNPPENLRRKSAASSSRAAPSCSSPRSTTIRGSAQKSRRTSRTITSTIRRQRPSRPSSAPQASAPSPSTSKKSTDGSASKGQNKHEPTGRAGQRYAQRSAKRIFCQ